MSSLDQLLEQIRKTFLNLPREADCWVFLEEDDFLIVQEYLDRKTTEMYGSPISHGEATQAGYLNVMYMGRPICLKPNDLNL